jgi:hypothetical protein
MWKLFTGAITSAVPEEIPNRSLSARGTPRTDLAPAFLRTEQGDRSPSPALPPGGEGLTVS